MLLSAQPSIYTSSNSAYSTHFIKKALFFSSFLRTILLLFVAFSELLKLYLWPWFFQMLCPIHVLGLQKTHTAPHSSWWGGDRDLCVIQNINLIWMIWYYLSNHHSPEWSIRIKRSATVSLNCLKLPRSKEGGVNGNFQGLILNAVAFPHKRGAPS